MAARYGAGDGVGQQVLGSVQASAAALPHTLAAHSLSGGDDTIVWKGPFRGLGRAAVVGMRAESHCFASLLPPHPYRSTHPAIRVDRQAPDL